MQAQSKTYIQLGTNISYLRTEVGKSKPGISVGIGRDFYPIRFFNGFVGLDLIYSKKRFKLENKSWPSNIEIEWSDVQIDDIPLDRSYLQINAKFGYDFSLVCNKTNIEIFAGPIFSIPLNYLSGSIIADSTIFLDPDERGKYEFDYLRCESEGADNILYWFLGIAVIYTRIGIEIHYERAWSRQKCIRGLTINDAMNSVHVLLSYSF